jgi:hypothetical protein
LVFVGDDEGFLSELTVAGDWCHGNTKSGVAGATFCF